MKTTIFLLVRLSRTSKNIQDLRTDHEKPGRWTIFGGAERPQKSSNCVSPDIVIFISVQYKSCCESRAERDSHNNSWVLSD